MKRMGINQVIMTAIFVALVFPFGCETAYAGRTAPPCVRPDHGDYLEWPPVSIDNSQQQAIDSLVRRGATVLTKSDGRGTRVTEVVLFGKQFDNQVIDELRLFPDLETLRCIEANVNDQFIGRLEQFPRLRVLGFFKAPITDVGLATLAASTVGAQLRQLLLGRTKITDAGLKSVAKLSRLYLLDLSGTNITDAGLGEVAKLERLKVFRFRGVSITDVGLAQLGNLRNLLLIAAGGSRVTPAGIAELRKQIPGLSTSDEEITLSVEER
jgi:hypothetical protein